MRGLRILAVFVIIASALPAGAQRGMGPNAAGLSGIWHPIVGSGGAYEITDKSGKMSELEITVVGKEDVEGKTAYWMEMAMATGRSPGNMYMKYLIAPAGSGMTFARMIMQQPGQDPIEMNMNIPGRGPQQNTPSDIREKAERVGTETITVPGGTFSCEHYRMKDGSADVWVSDKVVPWGLVKSQGKDSSMVLTKVITDATDHITGTPKKFDPSQILRGLGQPGR